MSSPIVRDANLDDADIIFKFINELADFEKAPQEVITNVDQLEETLFGKSPQAYALVAEIENQVIGYAIYFFSYSTWLGKQGIYLEDLYVSPSFRGHGAGKALLKNIAQIAVDENCGRLEWSVLDWNESAIDFYESFGAKPKHEWIVYRLDGRKLQNFAEA
ncbi:MAG: GNAT family N-acetyltransferase [Acidiferrobacterales bacterium]|nr:GNAT family N-acetyltransferase [Acidiferrobacterales bacterium]